jgi:hypothetical protein
MNKQMKRLTLAQETVRNLTQNQPHLMGLEELNTTLPWCPTGVPPQATDTCFNN